MDSVSSPIVPYIGKSDFYVKVLAAGDNQQDSLRIPQLTVSKQSERTIADCSPDA